jgi:hypothetical protein
VTGQIVPESVYDPDHDGDVDQPGVPDNDLLPSGEKPDIEPPAKANETEDSESYNTDDEDEEETEASISNHKRGNVLIFS